MENEEPNVLTVTRLWPEQFSIVEARDKDWTHYYVIVRHQEQVGVNDRIIATVLPSQILVKEGMSKPAKTP